MKPCSVKVKEMMRGFAFATLGFGWSVDQFNR
jgi:hypothetical protein